MSVLRRILFLLLIISFLPFLSCQKKIKTKEAEKSFLWEIQGDGGNSYIMGSIHLLKKEMYPLKHSIEDAFSKTDILVLEVDLSNGKMNEYGMRMMQLGMLKDNDTLEKTISKKTFNLLKKKLHEKFKADIKLYEKFAPWFLALTIQSMEYIKKGFNPQYGIDMHFLNKAKGKKEILGLETVEFQLELFKNFSKQDQENFLLYTLTELDQTNKYMNQFISAWLNGDTNSLEKLIIESTQDYPELKHITKKLIDDRNLNMAEKITIFLKNQKKYFIIVGAAHLVGKNGIISLLLKKGYQLKQI